VARVAAARHGRDAGGGGGVDDWFAASRLDCDPKHACVSALTLCDSPLTSADDNGDERDADDSAEEKETTTSAMATMKKTAATATVMMERDSGYRTSQVTYAATLALVPLSVRRRLWWTGTVERAQ
jgi:hypothetical protein